MNPIFLRAAKVAIDDSGSLTMEASAYGQPDFGGDVILPGAFGDDALAYAVSDGWLDVGHSWDGEGIGTIEEAAVDGDVLKMKATYYDTEDAQRIREKVSQRMERGKGVQVSIGYYPARKAVDWFEDGQALLDAVGAKGIDLSKWADAIAPLRWCRAIWKVERLCEVSIANMGMHPNARVVEARAADFPTGARAARLPDELEEAIASVSGVTKRLQEVAKTRAQDGRNLGADRLDQVRKLQGALAALTAASEPTPGRSGSDAERRQRALSARLRAGL